MKYFSKVEVDDNGEYFLTFPDELLQELGWKEGDLLEFKVEGDSIIITLSEAKDD